MTALLNAPGDLAASYDRDGVVLVPGLLTPAEVDEVRHSFTSHIEADVTLGFDDGLPDGDILRRYPRVIHPHRRTELEVGQLARRLMTDPRVIAVVEQLVGPALGAQSMFYFKPPGARGQALHQDNLFLQAHPETCIAAWIAVDDCDGENGGLVVIPGSHQIQILCPEDADPEESFTGNTVPVPEGAVRLQTEMRAGDVLFFHGSLVHGSRPNTTADRFRRSLIFHYVPRASVEVASFYLPLLDPDGREVRIAESPDGGPCGEAWTSQGH